MQFDGLTQPKRRVHIVRAEDVEKPNITASPHLRRPVIFLCCSCRLDSDETLARALDQ